MKQIILNIPDNKYSFFMEVVKNFDFIEVTDGDSKEDVISNLKEGLGELKLYKEGKLKTTSAKEFLNEL